MTRDEIKAHFRLYAPLVYRRALILLGHEGLAEQATREVLAQTMRERHTAPQRGPRAPWIYRATTNRCLEIMREPSVRKTMLAAVLEGAQDTVTIVGVPGQANMILLRGLLCEADEQQARAATYVYSDGLSQEEAAAMLSVSRQAVGALLEQFNRWARGRITAQAREKDRRRATSRAE